MLMVVLMTSISFGQYSLANSTTAKKGNVLSSKSKKTTDVVNRSVNATLWSDDFSNPDNWTISDNGANGQWAIVSTIGETLIGYGIAEFNPTSGPDFAVFDSDGAGDGANNSDLVNTNPIDCSGATSIILKFESYAYEYENSVFTVHVSTNGTDFTQVAELYPDLAKNTGTANPEYEEFNISDLVAGESTVYIKFNFQGNYDYFWAIDNVSLESIPPTADLVSTPAGFIAEYYSQPMDQAVAFTPEGNVSNIGDTLRDATDFKLTDGTYSDAQAITIPLAYKANEDITFASYTPAEGTVTFTYYTNYADDDDTSNDTITKDFVFGGDELRRDNGIVAGHIGIGSPGEEVGSLFTISAKDTITSIKWAMDGTEGDTVIAIIRNFTTEPTDEVGRTVLVVNNGEGNYEAQIIGQVILEPGTYFIGLIEGAHTVGIALTTDVYTANTAWAHFSDAWHDLGEMGYKHTYQIRPQFANFVATSNNVAIASINNDTPILEGNVDITGTVVNVANMEDLTSFDVTYTVDGGAASAVYSVTGVSIAQGETYDFTHNVQWAATAGSHTIEVTVSNPNGETDEDLTDNVISKTILVVKEKFVKNVVYEEGTGTWCGFCVRGLVGLNTMAHNITDGSWIGIGVHNGDPMVVTAYDNEISSRIGGYPSGLINRGEEIDPGLETLEPAYNTAKTGIPVAKIEITKQTWNSSTRDFTVDIASTFALDIASANYNAALIVVEDSVNGEGDDWRQHNYYAAGQPAAGVEMKDWDGFDYNDQPEYVPANIMKYNHVGRQLIGGWNGAAGSIPTSVTYNTANAYTFSGNIPADNNEKNTEFVAIIIDNATGKIVNATAVHLDYEYDDTGVNEITNSNLSIYPNPTTGLIKIEGAEGAQVVIYNMIGKVVYTENNVSTTATVDLSSFNAGNYIVKVIDNNTVTTQKIVLTK